MDEVLGTNEVMQQVASTFISYANAIASLLLVVFSPLFGVWIDNTGYKKEIYCLVCVYFHSFLRL
ncbi:hypothetical protein OL548_10730 [Lysinibacillus sp. MHQ-1]|nr:hypothetical protein OL548_10730 [Lysinibacillus sp. MHQ-1]